MMLLKVVRKIKKYILIYKTNKKYNCDISFKANIDNLSIFEGRNIVYSKTSIIQGEIGYATYISTKCIFSKTKIGRYCSIGSNVKIIAGNHPTSNYVSTHPIFYTTKDFAGLNYKHTNNFEEYTFVDDSRSFLCEIGNDVWIGEDVKIRNGVSIGDGAIIASGAFVSKNVLPYAIVGGVPAKIIRYRFEQEDIGFLLKLQWWNKGEAWISKYINLFDDVQCLREKIESYINN